jgi:hypothetical protein
MRNRSLRKNDTDTMKFQVPSRKPALMPVLYSQLYLPEDGETE